VIVVKVINFDGVEIEYEDSLFHRWSFLKGLHESSRQFSCMDELLCGKSDQVAEKLGVSRQTISKWETDETLPDIRQARHLAMLYHLSLDELIDFDVEVKEIEEIIERTSEETQQKIDWAGLWARKYPVLAEYPSQVRTEEYTKPLGELLEKLQREHQYSELDAFLVLKDIMAKVWQARKKG